MARFTKNSALIGAAFAALLTIGACSDSNDGPAESAGEMIDEAAEEAGDEVEEAADEVEEATD